METTQNAYLFDNDKEEFNLDSRLIPLYEIHLAGKQAGINPASYLIPELIDDLKKRHPLKRYAA